VDPDVEFTSLVTEADTVTYRGHQGVRKWWKSVRAVFSELWAESIDLQEVGEDQILARICLCGTIADTKIEQTIWQVLRVRDGKVVKWAVCRTKAEALEAALAQRDVSASAATARSRPRQAS
jgi:SnoaL-like protein